jgi:hypothetical protein
MAYKGLQLDIGKVENSIYGFSDGTKLDIKKVNASQHNYTISVPGQGETLLSFYFSKGKTTIDVARHRNQDLGNLIAEKIKNECSLIDPSARTIYKKDLSDEHFLEIQEYLTVNNVSISKPNEIAHGYQYVLSTRDGGTLFLTRYNNKAILLQGESIWLKHLMIEILSGVLPFKEVIDMQLQSIKSNTTTDQVLEQLYEIIPTAFHFLDDTLKTFIAPSVALKAYEVPVNDFAYILYPALRGLEGFVKKMFLDKGIEVGQSFGTFVSYNEKTDAATLDVRHNGTFSANEKSAIEEAYKYYRKNRHGLFHVDGRINTSRVVETKDEALDILGEIFDIFETCCKTYQS